MSGFDERDITIEHAKLADRSGYLRLTHRPSGISVDGYLRSEPVLKIKNELLDTLRRMVLVWLETRDRDETGNGGVDRSPEAGTGNGDVANHPAPAPADQVAERGRSES
jgi:hypothetical protein